MRYNAAAALTNLDEAARSAAAAIRQALGDPDAEVRVTAASALRNRDIVADEWMPVVRRALRDPNPDAPKAAEELMKLSGEGDLQFDINLGDDKQRGPIYYAANGGQTELVMILLDRKALPWVKGLMGLAAGTPLHEAAANGHIDTMELLLARGIPLNGAPRPQGEPQLKGVQGKTPLAMALEADDKETVALLKKYGAQ